GAGAWADDGLSRTRLAPVLDGDLVRRLDVGQVCYVYRGGVTFLQIKRLTGQQAAIGRGTGSQAAGSRRAWPGDWWGAWWGARRGDHDAAARDPGSVRGPGAR